MGNITSPKQNNVHVIDCSPVDSHIEGFVPCAACAREDDREFGTGMTPVFGITAQADWFVTVGTDAGTMKAALCDFHAEMLAAAIDQARAA